MTDILDEAPAKADLVKPMVHLNGRGKQNLLESYLEQARAVNEAAKVLHQNGPNMRDYYPLDKSHEVFQLACRQHAARIQRLNDVLNELQELMEHVDQ